MNLKQLVKKEVESRGGKIKTKLRIRIGKVLFAIAVLPLFTAWLYPIAIPMMTPIKFQLWAKDKIKYFQEWRSLR